MSGAHLGRDFERQMRASQLFSENLRNPELAVLGRGRRARTSARSSDGRTTSVRNTLCKGSGCAVGTTSPAVETFDVLRVSEHIGELFGELVELGFAQTQPRRRATCATSSRSIAGT
jgi:hypothetical protein